MKNKHLQPPESGTELFLVELIKYESTFGNTFKMLQNFTEIINYIIFLFIYYI